MRIGMYSPEIIYKPGKENIVADMLSRLFEDPDATQICNEDYTDRVVATLRRSAGSEVSESESEDVEIDTDTEEELDASGEDRIGSGRGARGTTRK